MGTVVNKPTDPTRTGYTFTGWFSAAFGGTRYTWPHTLTATVTLHAQWAITTVADLVILLTDSSSMGPSDPIPVKITVDLADPANGWTAILNAITFPYNKYVSLDLSDCTRPGTVFDPGTANTGKNRIVSLVLPGTARSIPAGTDSNPTFQDFTSLKTLAASGVETVGDWAFYECAGLESVFLPAAETIEWGAFNGCTGLTTLSLPVATTIGGFAFNECTGLTSLSLPVATTIGGFAFNGCTGLTTLSLPVATTIGVFAFYECTGLTSLSLPKAESIGEGAFAYCTGLTSLTLPVVDSIGDYAFYECTGLTTLSLPKAESIGGYAFIFCTGLRSVSLPASLTAIGINPFAGCVNLTGISVDAANLVYTARNGMLLNKAETVLIAYPAANGDVTLTTITGIGDGAFGGCTGLTSVSLPMATSIGEGAFDFCTGLRSLTLPVAETIGYQAFAETGGTALTITLGAEAPSLAIDLFYDVSVPKTVTVRVPAGATGYGTIPATYSGADATNNWGNAFRGKGWNGTNYLGGTVNSNVTLTIGYTP
jgi:uncharacterized repeat protein (TIGR02543 family)